MKKTIILALLIMSGCENSFGDNYELEYEFFMAVQNGDMEAVKKLGVLFSEHHRKRVEELQDLVIKTTVYCSEKQNSSETQANKTLLEYAEQRALINSIKRELE